MGCGNAEYHKEYDRSRYLRKKSQLVDYLGGKCEQCGSTSDLEFDHIDPATKSFTIMTNWKWSLERLQDELAKCQLLCFDCHEAKHATDHGRRWMYSQGCRCDDCRQAESDYQKERRQLNKQARLV